LLPRRIALEQRVLAHNDRQAALNRERFRRAGVLVVNLLSAPGSGKTSLLERLARLAPPASAPPSAAAAPQEGQSRACGSGRQPWRRPSAGRSGTAAPADDQPLAGWSAGTAAAPAAGLRQAVIVGDLATDNDARRLRSAGLAAVQISTGQGCHLEASQVAAALDRLEQRGAALADLDLLWIENVGNLVCPAAYDLGEQLRLVLLAAGEGEDKPLKYPALFHSADVVLISKVDLAAAVRFRRRQAHRAIRRVAPQARIVEASARTGEGLPELIELLRCLSPRPAASADPEPPWRQPGA
jgi:hydrogenase nickel incorporation protein HypB